MTGDQRPPPAFRAEHYDLVPGGLSLSAVTTAEAPALGAALAAIEPWARYGTSAANLASLFAPTADGGIRLAIRRAPDATPIGGMVIRQPWLVGPYMQFLGLLPGAQGAGFGSAILAWYEAQARAAGMRNVWICAASFNEGAMRLYERCGFEHVVVLDDLIKPGFDEVLMRKRL